MYCANCGSTIDDNAVFCGNCGWKVGEKVLDTGNNDLPVNDGHSKSVRKENSSLIKSLAIVIVLAIVVGVLFYNRNTILSLINRKKDVGSFQVVNGFETYYVGKRIVKDSLVSENGTEFYVDGNGRKVISTLKLVNDKLYYFDKTGASVNINGWVDNLDPQNASDYSNGTYYCEGNKIVKDKWIGGSYVGKDGRLVKNNWVDDYYCGSDGKYARNKWVNDYYCGTDGKYVKNAWVGGFYCGADGKKVKNAWIDGYYVGADGLYMVNAYTPDGNYVGADGKLVPKKTTQPTTVAVQNQQTIAPTQAAIQAPIETQASSSANENSDKELYILSSLIVNSEYEGNDEQTCKISVSKPRIAGMSMDEANTFNDVIDGLVDEIILELENKCGEYTSTPKSIKLSKPEMSTLTSKRARIVLTGKLTPRSGSQKNVKYRINLDREDGSGDYEDLSN